MSTTPIWQIEGIELDSTGDLIPDSLGDVVKDILVVTDALPDSGAMTGISDETDKIDNAATDGLAGVSNSLAYRVQEIERHFHGWEQWYEAATAPSGTIHTADRIGGGAGAFQIDAGNDDWGSWVCILGSEDTNAVFEPKFDMHRLEITATERNFEYFFQIAFGATGAAGLAAGTYTEAVFNPASNQVDSGPVTIMTRRQDAGELAWARCMCPGQNTATLDFYFGMHIYEG